jgi:uncharacterized protein (TIGR00290 family)
MPDDGVILSWSSGKDSAWSLHELRGCPEIEVRALITTFNERADRVAMHAVRRELVRAQAEAAGLPLVEVALPWPCSNDDYERAFGASLRVAAKQFETTQIAFGDLYLRDIRDYRERQIRALGFSGLFPLWEKPTDQLARDMIGGGVRATLSCVDPTQLDPTFVGREFDSTLLDDLPDDVDPCGENGEFHTFTWAGPMFRKPIQVETGEKVTRDGFCFADIVRISMENNGS